MSAARSVFQLVVGMVALSSRPVLAVLHEGGALPEREAVWVHRLVGAMVETGQKAFRALARGAQLLAPVTSVLPLRRWEDLGRAEERAGVMLANIVVARVRDAVFDQMARSSQLKELVRTQSEGLTHSAIKEVRSVGAEADERAEQLVHRLFRRTR